MPTLHANSLLTRSGIAPFPELSFGTGGLIETIASGTDRSGDGTLLAPALLDVHTHGAVGEDVMTATPAGFERLQRFLATRGVGWYLPTTVTASLDATLAAVERIAAEIERGPRPLQAQPLGVHLEGPFLSHAKRGVHPAEHLLAPEIATFDRLYEAARGHVAMLTLAPELPGAAALIRHAVARGVRVALGHSNADTAEALDAVAAGASSATHTFNAMRPLDHREPGVLGVALDDGRLYAELICDGVHVAPAMVRLWYRMKGVERAVLVTDSMPATGAPDGDYTLGGLPVVVRGGRALLRGDLDAGKETLAGSVLTMDAAVRNLAQLTGCPASDAVRAASYAPGALLGRGDLLEVKPGVPANLTVWDAEGRLIETYLRGDRIPTSG